jgi:hypothetical protein
LGLGKTYSLTLADDHYMKWTYRDNGEDKLIASWDDPNTRTFSRNGFTRRRRLR